MYSTERFVKSKHVEPNQPGVAIIATNGTRIAECKTKGMADKIVRALEIYKEFSPKRIIPKIDELVAIQEFNFWILGLLVKVSCYINRTGSEYAAEFRCASLLDDDLTDVEIEGYSLYVEGRFNVSIEQLLQEEALKRWGDEHEEG